MWTWELEIEVVLKSYAVVLVIVVGYILNIIIDLT